MDLAVKQQYDLSDGLLPNRMKGRVGLIRKGLTEQTMKVHLGRTLSLKVRWKLTEKERVSTLGEGVEITIPPEAIYVVPVDSPPIKERWTCWRGRVVLVGLETDGLSHKNLITIKIRGESLALRSTTSLFGKGLPPVGLAVKVLIDPKRVMCVESDSSQEECSPDPLARWSDRQKVFPQVFVKGIIVRTHGWSNRFSVVVKVGGAVVTAILDHIPEEISDWSRGEWVKLLIDQQDAWIKLLNSPCQPLPCFLNFLSTEDPETTTRFSSSAPSFCPKNGP